MFAPEQASLFGAESVSIDTDFATLQRTVLQSGAWVDYAPAWLTGDELLLDEIATAAEWSSPEVRMYDKVVKTPRLVARFGSELHPNLPDMVEVLSDRYKVRLDRLSAGFYRDGSDSVAWHGDRIARDLPEAVVATVSLGGPRRFLMRPAEGGPSIAYSLGQGDLIVMGGSCQRTYRHTVPKVATAPPRIALMFRHDYD
ncbi:MAG: alpha-ketoglutarate-dependent dioxygenase AlkB [Acidimicrobiia bacterium]|nr:alpha-ketoglutarate-dependent dioxygenase AlkB [Acidimicrobiia bacterium]